MTANAQLDSLNDIGRRLNAVLVSIQAPPLHDSAWIGPFEQLVGATFSLIESEKRGFSQLVYSPVYHRTVQCKIASVLAKLDVGTSSEQQDALDNWLSRYYFNSGIQRLSFAAERLIATFASIPCKCGNRPPEIAIKNNQPPRFPERLKGAQDRLAHVRAESSEPLGRFDNVLNQLATRYERDDPFDPVKGLAMIRQDVNSRKHSVYRRSECLEVFQRPISGLITWSTAGFKARMDTGTNCLELVAYAYAEMLQWQPNAKS